MEPTMGKSGKPSTGAGPRVRKNFVRMMIHYPVLLHGSAQGPRHRGKSVGANAAASRLYLSCKSHCHLQ